MVRRIFVEKKEPYAVHAKQLTKEARNYLGLKDVKIRYVIRYDIENSSDDVFKRAKTSVFSEPPVDILYEEELPVGPEEEVFGVEPLPGQYDQRADSAEQCLRFLGEREKCTVKTAEILVVSGICNPSDLEKIQGLVINPVDSRLSSLEKPRSLKTDYPEPGDIEILTGFRRFRAGELKERYDSLGLAMTFNDFKFIRDYFKSDEKRDPTLTEIRVLDTYWSDHCRHTTFLTELKDIEIGKGFYNEPVKKALEDYFAARKSVYGKEEDKKPACLMDMALLGAKVLKKNGLLEDQEKSDEINACSIVVPVSVKDGSGKTHTEDWLLMFKNETHNHPTEIEPFGGAATCLGGAIRDPLSGRSYVYQAMRVTGASDPRVPVSETIRGKLPQRKLTVEAAHGYSSYGNQVGLATGLVDEIYHPGYLAKRMEIGAVLGAAPVKNVVRGKAEAGDLVILLGGRTGRDGIGGATGASKAHTEASIASCGAEVQKGNAPTERKLQRLFRRKEASLLIKVCNDFGAGGVAVAVGELAPGLKVDLDRVPKKYAGLDGTELAISESQERMAVVISSRDRERFLSLAAEENLEATVIAEVTKEPRLVMTWRDKEIVNLSRDFLNSNGAKQETKAAVVSPDEKKDYIRSKIRIGDEKKAVLDSISSLGSCSRQGLAERFDSSIGAATVTMPFGGKYQKTPIQAMAALFPVTEGTTDTVSLMSYGFDPDLSSWSPFHGAVYAVTGSITKIVAAGGDLHKIRFTFQEYFRRMTEKKKDWGYPVAALLGAFEAQLRFGLPSIGGKDSMSGSFEKLNVPPTLVSFAVDTGKVKDIITGELKKAGNILVKFSIEVDEYGLPVYEEAAKLYEGIGKAQRAGIVKAAYALDEHGIAPALLKMAFGNMLGAKISDSIRKEELFLGETGNILAEISDKDKLKSLKVPFRVIGEVIPEAALIHGKMKLGLNSALEAYEGTLSGVFPLRGPEPEKAENDHIYREKNFYINKHKTPVPKVFIPVFPGTNCEYDSERAFRKAGAETVVQVFSDLSERAIIESTESFEKTIRDSQIIMFPGGFSAGDEPDGSAKFFATAFRNERIRNALDDLINRDGLILGICNGFQALIKLGLLPYGRVIPSQKPDSPTLTFNTVNRHVSRMAYTKVVSDKSPWLRLTEPGKTYVSPASHGEGRFVASVEWLDRLFKNGQIALQYADPDGNVAETSEYNINGSFRAIEGITDETGRILGKMCHAERSGEGVNINIYGEQNLRLFEAGVKYFS